jgi:PTH1 family peptidyl-tRNA hydrolase
MKLIVGLGNPGRDYEHTRHNVGFQVAEELARRYRVTLKNYAKWKARAVKIPDIGDGVLVAEPTTFMNLSGWAVREIASFHKLATSDLLIVYDDADLPLGRLRLRANGSAGGHNGLKSIIQELAPSSSAASAWTAGRRAEESRPGEIFRGREGAD